MCTWPVTQPTFRNNWNYTGIWNFQTHGLKRHSSIKYFENAKHTNHDYLPRIQLPRTNGFLFLVTKFLGCKIVRVESWLNRKSVVTYMSFSRNVDKSTIANRYTCKCTGLRPGMMTYDQRLLVPIDWFCDIPIKGPLK